MQAFKYLREEVKTFQGKPIMVRLFHMRFQNNVLFVEVIVCVYGSGEVKN